MAEVERLKELRVETSWEIVKKKREGGEEVEE